VVQVVDVAAAAAAGGVAVAVGKHGVSIASLSKKEISKFNSSTI